ncbi:MAG: precorrin-6A/cobalt-precorrin-6A reductase [Desulfitobacteriaceae bacterium]|nr:precorrin-6A/cobalt-precorrin-6A reductase [Clostridia bacterium]MDD4345485.1 precorrin-6A/cobalt-precorrin-6A reductase [Desulfitobacteriaceae bacterium]MDD4400630.1 precorrin-6A/cobalt-precorrin-6A reductase [Desulfitobacteriaceae bacterium]
MIILLGETPAALKISEHLQNRDIEFIKTPTWPDNSLAAPSIILDVSHPSNERLLSLGQFCEQSGIPYLRLARPETGIPNSSLISRASNWEEATLCMKERICTLYEQKGRLVTVFVTTGSHQLESIVHSSFADKARFVVRVLPEGRLVQKCQDMGIYPRDILAMRGPFSKDINKALFKFYGADLIFTRDTGLADRMDTKITAALELKLEILLIRKKKASCGLIMDDLNELLGWIDKNISK